MRPLGILLHRLPLSTEKAHRELEDDSSGGVVVFVGRVRPDRSRGRQVLALVYEADERMALDAMAQLDQEVRRRFGVRRVVVHHRLGRLPVGTPSVIVGASAPHRDAALRATRYLIRRLKRVVPIWKTEVSKPARPRKRPEPSDG